MRDAASGTPSETAHRNPIDPVRRLDEARKQIRIADEKAEVDVSAQLQTAAEEIRAAQAKLSLDDG